MAKIQGEDAKLVGVSLEVVNVVLGALDNTHRGTFAKEA